MTISRRGVLRSAAAASAAALLPGAVARGANAGRDVALPLVSAPEADAGSDAVPLVSLDDYEEAARARLDARTWAFIASGAADELTLRWNREAFERVVLAPRAFEDMSHLDTAVTVLGHRLAAPIMLAPTAVHRLVHPDGELATARAARASGVGMVLSSFTSTPIESVAREGPSPLWFQLYLQDRGFTAETVQRVAAAGCSALCLTIDTATTGVRNRQVRAGFTFPEGLPHLQGGRARSAYPVTWKDLAWLRTVTSLPIIPKGVLSPDDAARAVDAGVAAIYVSNHGARNLDTAPATLTVLPRVVDRVAGRVPVLFDGGVRRGTDVLKALAYGASAVLVGRPLLYGLAVDGAAGLANVISILRREFEIAMGLAGRASVAAIGRDALWT